MCRRKVRLLLASCVYVQNQKAEQATRTSVNKQDNLKLKHLIYYLGG